MLIQIRVALICAGTMISAISVAQTVQDPWPTPPTLANEYTDIVVVPPSFPKTTVTTSQCWNTGSPFVELYVSSQVSGSSDVNPNHQDPARVSARYVAAKEVSSCSFDSKGIHVYVKLKSAPINSALGDDAVKLAPSHNQVLLENDRVRVVRVHFEPGESGPIVDKRPRVIAAVTDSHATVTFPDGHSETRDVKAGTVSFGNPGRQATKNTGTTALENIVVELKSK